MDPIKISARAAGVVELETYCPRDLWYVRNMKKMPFEFGMPGLMFRMEQAEKAFVEAHLAKYKGIPKHLKPFADCVSTVEFPFRFYQEHSPTGILVSAQIDMLLQKRNGNLCLWDLKTAQQSGGGLMFVPQYEIQVIGYSWAAQQEGLGTVETAGLVYCEIQIEDFCKDPLKFKTAEGFSMPFAFTDHEVELDFSRFDRCLKEVKSVLKRSRPPKGTEGCKNCILLNRLFDLEDRIRAEDAQFFAYMPDARDAVLQQQYFRRLARGTQEEFNQILNDSTRAVQDGSPWFDWDFS